MVFPGEALEDVLKHLKAPDLVSCSLVSRDWRHESLYAAQTLIRVIDLTKQDANGLKKQLFKLEKVLSGSNCANYLFQNLSINLDSVETWLSNTKCVKEHGHRLRSLVLGMSVWLARWRDNLHRLELISLRLNTVLSSFQNIETLEIDSEHIMIQYRMPSYFHFQGVVQINPNHLLNLKTLILPNSSIIGLQDIFRQILQAAYNLTRLTVYQNSIASTNHINNNTVWNNLFPQNLSVCSRLEEFQWKCNGNAGIGIQRVLQVLSTMELSNLKVLRIGDSIDGDDHHRIYLLELLSKTASELQILECNGEYRAGPIPIEVAFCMPKFPKLNALQINSENAYGIPSMAFIENCPELKKLYIKMEPKDVSHPPGSSTRVNEFFETFLRRTHGLQSLHLASYLISDIRTIHLISSGFQNLKCLYFKSAIPLDHVTPQLVAMSNLESLNLYDDGPRMSAGQALRSFQHLPTIPKLKKFTLTLLNKSFRYLHAIPFRAALVSLGEDVKFTIRLTGYIVTPGRFGESIISEYVSQVGLAMEIKGLQWNEEFPIL